MVTKVAEQQAQLIQLAESHSRTKLNQNDLSNRVSRSTIAVIDTAITQRGAFKGEELSTIGYGLRDQAAQLIQLAEAYQADDALKDIANLK
jgi:hypothetical protein